jgi:uncharacterized protein YjbJ (UPF0337 family)
MTVRQQIATWSIGRRCCSAQTKQASGLKLRAAQGPGGTPVSRRQALLSGLVGSRIQHNLSAGPARIEEHAMDVNKDQVKGRTKEVEGKVNEITGKVIGDKKLEVKGKIQQIGGEARAKLGDVKQNVKDAAKNNDE